MKNINEIKYINCVVKIRLKCLCIEDKIKDALCSNKNYTTWSFFEGLQKELYEELIKSGYKVEIKKCLFFTYFKISW